MIAAFFVPIDCNPLAYVHELGYAFPTAVLGDPTSDLGTRLPLNCEFLLYTLLTPSQATERRQNVLCANQTDVLSCDFLWEALVDARDLFAERLLSRRTRDS